MALVLNGTTGIVVADGATIGSTSDTDAITIPSTGRITFNQAILAQAGVQPNSNSFTTAEVIDDYEEGTWTPIYSPVSGSFPTISYTATVGRYTKVGRMVFAAFSFGTNGLSSISTASGDLRIAGLPFAGHSSNPRMVSAFMAGRFASDTPVFGIIVAGTSVAVLRENFDTTTQANDLDVTGNNNRNVSEGVFTYMTD